MKESGFGLGIILSIVVAIFTWIALNLLIVSGKKLHVYRFADLCEATMGRFGFYLLNIMVFLLTAGACITYMVVIGDTIPVILTLVGITAGRSVVIFWSSLLFILPLLFFRSIGSLARASMVSVMLLPPILLVVAIRGMHYAPEHDHELTFVGDNVFPAIGVMAFALLSTQTAFMNFMTLKRPTRARWATATGAAVFGSWGISFVFALIGYLCFGNDVQPNIFNSFPPQDTLINIGRGLLGFSMFLTYPQAFYPARAAAHKVLGHEGRHNSNQHDKLSVEGPRLPTQTEHVATTTALFAASLIGGMYLTDLGIAYQLIGGLCATFLAYIIPGTCYFLVFWSSQERKRREVARREYSVFQGGNRQSEDEDARDELLVGHVIIYEYDQSDAEEDAKDDDVEEGRRFSKSRDTTTANNNKSNNDDETSKTPLIQASPKKTYGATDLSASPSSSTLQSFAGGEDAIATMSSLSSTLSFDSTAEIGHPQIRYCKTVWWHDIGAACLVVFGVFVMILSTSITVGKMLQ
ncbi:hypothetical protein BGW41_003655 [Actinomortierella wolfii]|nr:hypothetical protein BGW41_003655 [Actinomortierella wolfii]